MAWAGLAPRDDAGALARVRRPLPTRRTLVTGGAGFIGGGLVESLIADGSEVTILDDLSAVDPDWQGRLDGAGDWCLIVGDVADERAVMESMAGCERVVHLAAGTDIAGGFGDPAPDFRSGVVGTQVVCAAMHRLGVREIWYASSGVVYGGGRTGPTKEGDGPYRPASHYAAAKLAGEAVVSGFALLYGWRAIAYRFGNTVGRGSDHGIVHDLVVKLLRDPTCLELLGDGRQAKPYVHVSDLVDAMRHAAGACGEGFTVLNVGTVGTVTVDVVADEVIAALGLDSHNVARSHLRVASDGGGWIGDTPIVEFDTSAIAALGWRPTMTPREAIRRAAVDTVEWYRSTGRPLLTAAERRENARTVA